MDHASLFEYLCLRDEQPQQVNMVVGFGHFDPEIARHCGHLYETLKARAILFTGGVGAGSADLGKPEADFFREQCQQHYPHIPEHHIFTENQSTNTAENLDFSAKVLQQQSPDWHFGQGIQTLALVASPYRQRRVHLTAALSLPSHLRWSNLPPPGTYLQEVEKFALKGQDLDTLLVGELQRIHDYPRRGWIAPTEIPASLLPFLAT